MKPFASIWSSEKAFVQHSRYIGYRKNKAFSPPCLEMSVYTNQGPIKKIAWAPWERYPSVYRHPTSTMGSDMFRTPLDVETGKCGPEPNFHKKVSSSLSHRENIAVALRPEPPTAKLKLKTKALVFG